MDVPTEDEDYLGRLMLMNTALEKQIGLGPDYPFEPLGQSECILSNQYSTLVSQGESIYIAVWWFGYLLDAMARDFNNQRTRG